MATSSTGRYLKPPLCVEEQANLLIRRGIIADKSALVKRLAVVSYYRLSAYWLPFQLPDETFRAGTTLETIWERYVFDRQLRLLAIDALERFEIALRARLVNAFAGPFGHLDPANLPDLEDGEYQDFVKKVRLEVKRSKDKFIEQYFLKYPGEQDVPVWMAAEVMSFGMLLTMFRGSKRSVKQAAASQWGIADTVLESWLLSLNYVRNICAHHGRLWNRELAVKPLIPHERKHPAWHKPVLVTGNRVFGVFTILRYLLGQIAPQSHWSERLQNLFGQHQNVPLADMGFPDNWLECPIWQPESPAGAPEEAWAVTDARADAQALVSLSEFLATRGLRRQGSACQDAMDAISRLQEEVRQLRAAPGQG
jgi:abortive infection bacteriophage resistance protein